MLVGLAKYSVTTSLLGTLENDFTKFLKEIFIRVETASGFEFEICCQIKY